jgi:hypothetical protein
MKTFFLAVVALAAGTNALIARGGSCCFHLTASGGVSGSIGQLSDGQNRIGGELPVAQYCIDSNGGLTDQAGRGCILTRKIPSFQDHTHRVLTFHGDTTAPTTQFQCDSGASPLTGFSVGCDGTLSYNGNSKFFACQTGENGELNLYTTDGPDKSGCTDITLAADSCNSGCPAPPPSPPAPQPKTCPAALSGTYEYPHLIIPVDSASPNTAAGTSYNGQVSTSVSSIFNFDIPFADQGKTCSLVFLFPEQKDLQTSSYTISGSGSVDFSALSGVASSSTTYANCPGSAADYGSFTLVPGNSYTIATFDCPAGQSVSYKMTSSSTSLTYFQDYNPSP